MRVVQLGLGPIGRAIAKQALGHVTLDLVGAADPLEGIAGCDLGRVLGTGELGLTVDSSTDTLLDREKPDLALHAVGSRLAPAAAGLASILERGIHVISTCEELAYPFYRHPALASELDQTARRAGVFLLGSGINPGFVMDKLVVTMMCACTQVRSVEVIRVVDAATRREPFQRKIGSGLTPAEFDEGIRSGRIGHVGLIESAHMIADAMGVAKQREVEESARPVVARKRIETDCLAVDVGQVSGLEQSAEISVGGRERVRMALRMELGAERPHDAVRIDGAPPVEFEAVTGVPGDEGTAAVMLHSASSAGALAAGLRTMLDVPLRPAGTSR